MITKWMKELYDELENDEIDGNDLAEVALNDVPSLIRHIDWITNEVMKSNDKELKDKIQNFMNDIENYSI